MKTGYFSPMPPARTGVADYAASLLAELRRHGTVEIAPGRCDVTLYHVGNNPLHADIYRRAVSRPGVVLLHDAALNHFHLGQLNEAQYVNEFVYNYGEWNRELGRRLWRERAGSASDERYFRYAMLRRIAESARAVVVHNPAAAAIVREHAPEARILEIPHLYAPPPLPDEASVLRYRQAMGIHPGVFLFGLFGYLRESKRVVSVLEAYRALRRTIPHAGLLLAGDFVSSDLERAIAPALREPGVYRLPYLRESEFWLAARATDACINLRYPTAGESSGISVRMMGLGKPVLMTEGSETVRIPDDACLRIPHGPGERDALWHYMVLLTSVADVAGEIGRRAADHIAAHHRVDRIGKQFWDVLCECSLQQVA